MVVSAECFVSHVSKRSGHGHPFIASRPKRKRRVLDGAPGFVVESAEFEGGQGEEGEDEGQDPEAGDDFGFAPAELFEVVM